MSKTNDDREAKARAIEDRIYRSDLVKYRIKALEIALSHSDGSRMSPSERNQTAIKDARKIMEYLFEPKP